MEGFEPARTAVVFDSEADVVEKVLVGVGDAAVGGAHPDGLRVEIGKDSISGFAFDESFFVLFASGDVDGEATEAYGYTVNHDGVAPAFEPEDLAIGSPDLKILHDHLTGFDPGLNGGGDDRNEFGKEDSFEGAIVGNVFERMAKDRIGASAIGDFSGGIFDVPCSHQGGLLDGGEEILLLLEHRVGLPAFGDVVKEENNAIVKGAALDGEPNVERVGVEGLKLARDAFLHGSFAVIEDFALLGGGELQPEILAEEFSGRAQQLFGATIEKGKIPVAVDAGHGVGCGFEDLPELADRGVAKELGAFAVGDVVIIEGYSFVGRVDRDVDPGIDALGVILHVGLLAGAHDVAVEMFKFRTDEVRVDLPIRPAVDDLGRSNSAAAARLLLREGDNPVSIDAYDPCGDLGQEAGKALVPHILLALEKVASLF